MNRSGRTRHDVWSRYDDHRWELGPGPGHPTEEILEELREEIPTQDDRISWAEEEGSYDHPGYPADPEDASDYSEPPPAYWDELYEQAISQDRVERGLAS